MAMTEREYILRLEEIDNETYKIQFVEKIILDEFKLNNLAITDHIKSLILDLAILTASEQKNNF